MTLTDLVEVIDNRGRTLTPCRRKVAEREVRLNRAKWIGPRRIRLRFDPFAYRYVRLKVLARDNHICYWCGLPGDTMDHIIPWSKGGRTTMDNCICACQECNGARGDMSAEQFARLKHVTPPDPSRLANQTPVRLFRHPQRLVTRLEQGPIRLEHKITQPQQQAARPEQQATRPQQQATQPQQQAARPQQQTARPEQQATRPQQQTARPQQQATRPQQQTARPQQQATRPARHGSEPANSNGKGPAQDLSLDLRVAVTFALTDLLDPFGPRMSRRQLI